MTHKETTDGYLLLETSPRATSQKSLHNISYYSDVLLLNSTEIRWQMERRRSHRIRAPHGNRKASEVPLHPTGSRMPSVLTRSVGISPAFPGTRFPWLLSPCIRQASWDSGSLKTIHEKTKFAPNWERCTYACAGWTRRGISAGCRQICDEAAQRDLSGCWHGPSP